MNILDSVVRNGHCCSCGMCAAICPGRHLQMRETDHGEYRPQTTGSCPDRCSMCVQVCPFSNEHGENEDTLGRQWFGSGAACAHDDALGWVRDTFVGGVADEAQRLQAPSGGLASALLCRLLQLGEIDASIVLQPLARRPWWQSRIAETDQQVLASRGSVYHVAPFDKTLADVLGGPERSYAVVALPCAAKSLRLAQRRIPALRRRIRYVLGLTCGGYRNLLFADLLTGLMGCGDGVLRYRSKRHAHTGRDYRAELVTEETVRSVKMLGLFGYLWANEVGALQSCLFCDDVFAELADATFMDAWLPDYDKDRRGTSLVISRSERLSQLLTVLFDTGAWEGGRIARERVVQSQRGLLQRRRKLLAARCQVASQTLAYVPTKRSGINPPPSSDADLAEAHREMTYFHKAREALLRFHHATARTSPRTTRWHAWRLCAKILLLAWRYGCLSKTLRGAAHLFRQKLSARVP